MNLLKGIFNKVLLFEVRIENDYADISFYIVKYKSSNLVYQPQGKNKAMERWKNNIAILSVTGEQIASRTYREEDAAIRKIVENEQLIWSISQEVNDNAIISFLRKELINEVTSLLDKNKIHIAETWISRNEIPNKDEKITAFLNKKINISHIRRSRSELNLFSELLYHKIKLPILILIFCALLANFFANNNIRKEYEQNQILLTSKQRDSKTKAEKDGNSRVSGEYAKIPIYSYALIADKIASYVPDNVRLGQLTIFPIGKNSPRNKGININPKSVIIKGDVDIPGSITLFTQFLSADNLFSKVDIVSLSRKEGATIFEFELLITVQ